MVHKISILYHLLIPKMSFMKYSVSQFLTILEIISSKLTHPSDYLFTSIYVHTQNLPVTSSVILALTIIGNGWLITIPHW